MMLHPAKGPMTGTGAAVVGTFALRHLTIEYFGKPAHAGMAPWEGVNALDAATIAYASISALRQQLKSETRCVQISVPFLMFSVHGVITDGGSAPNVIPAHTELKYIVRATTDKEVGKTLDKVVACFEGAAQVSGCKVKISVTDPVAELRNERTLAVSFVFLLLFSPNPD
jgi:metal-dependent amidase/aminoacylase/carboxypeptidase family protein